MTTSERLDAETPACTNTYGSESGECEGPAEFCAVLFTGPRRTVKGRDVIDMKTRRTLGRTGPLCQVHADYEGWWRNAIDAVAHAHTMPLADVADTVLLSAAYAS